MTREAEVIHPQGFQNGRRLGWGVKMWEHQRESCSLEAKILVPLPTTPDPALSLVPRGSLGDGRVDGESGRPPRHATGLLTSRAPKSSK